MTVSSAHSICVFRFQKVIKESEGRWTAERNLLLRVICNTTRHFHSEDLMALITDSGANISKATVYRSLPLLEQAGIIRQAVRMQTSSREGAIYEHVLEGAHHDHLVCSQCGRTVEFEYPAIEVLQEAVARDHGFVLERHHMELVGLCADCRAEDKPE